MAKTSLSATQAFELRQVLHVATLEALMASRRWRPGELVFQGGTSLHLAHGSPRFSEDIDFLVDSGLNLASLSTAVQSRLDGAYWLPQGTSLKVGKARDKDNPHAFVVSVGGQDVIGSVKVKVEMWRTPQAVLQQMTMAVAPVRMNAGPAAGMTAFVPTADLDEIMADKVFALVARPYLKARDVFDLYWLGKYHGRRQCSIDALRTRLDTYPNAAPQDWLADAQTRRDELLGAAQQIALDLRKWLPPGWPVSKVEMQAMIEASVQAIDMGVPVMREIHASGTHERPSQHGDDGAAVPAPR